MKCRHCKTELKHEFIDLINSPASNDLLDKEKLNQPETYYPLKIFACHNCFLVQVDEYKKSEDIFNAEYVYFSSFSTSWLEHAQKYTNQMASRFGYDSNSFVVEIASNDGYLLQYFNEKAIPVMGVEPTKNTAEVAIKKGISTKTEFFTEQFALENFKTQKADLLIGNNVLAHVPDINDFVKGLKAALAPNGVITMEFPHLLNLINKNQFDTIYHEHFSYLSFFTVKRIFEAYGLQMFDIEEITTHGGSLRIYAKHYNDNSKTITQAVEDVLKKEEEFGLLKIDTYLGFTEKAQKIKLDFINFLITQKTNNKKVAGYGAAAKGNTLLNYCGVKNDLIDFCVDASPHKQNKYMPGSHIPILDKSALKKHKPDFVVIFPWNIKEEIIEQHSYISDWGGKFVIAIPKLEII